MSKNEKVKPNSEHKGVFFKVKKWGKIISLILIVLACIWIFSGSNNNNSETVSSINTKFNPINSHSIETIRFIDPDISNVYCFISSAKTGGIKGSMGLAEDLSDMSLSCVMKGNTAIIKNKIKSNVEVYKESRNITFKKLRVMRYFDVETNIVYYISYADKVLDGDSANATSAVWLGDVDKTL